MEIIRAPITIEELREKHMHFFKSIVKAVVDIKRKVVAVDGELHSDLEKLLLEVGVFFRRSLGNKHLPF